MNKITCTKTALLIPQRGQLYKLDNATGLINLYTLTRITKDSWIAISLLDGRTWVESKDTAYEATIGLTPVPAGSEYTLVAE